MYVCLSLFMCIHMYEHDSLVAVFVVLAIIKEDLSQTRQYHYFTNLRTLNFAIYNKLPSTGNGLGPGTPSSLK